VCARRQASTAKLEGEKGGKDMDLGALAAAAVVSLSTFLPVPAAWAEPVGNWTVARDKPVHQSSFEAPYGARLEARWEQRSQGSTRETYVLVSNASRRSLDLMWINYIGEEEHYATIPMGTSLLQQSYATHPWVVRDHVNQSMVAVLSADLEVTVAVIGLEEEDRNGMFNRADEALSMIQRVKMSNSNDNAGTAGIRFTIE